MSRRIAVVVLLLLAGWVPSEARASFVLSGQAVTETGAPVEGVTVELTKARAGYEQGLRWLDGEAEPEVLAVAVTDETGWYWLEVPRQGIWRVAVDAPGYVPMERRPEAYIGDERLATVALVRDAGLEVTVTAEGEPLAGARVWAASTLSSDGVWAAFDRRQWRPSWPGRLTDERGRATLPRARDERLRVVAWKDGFLQVEQADTVRPVTLETTVASERRVIQVVDSRGKPVKQVLVRVGEDPSWSAGTTGEDGAWELALPMPGELTLRADAGDGRWVTKTFEKLPEEGPLVLELPQPTVFSGRVSDAETGASLAGALVFLDLSGWYAETGDDGRYRLAITPPGESLGIEAVAPGYRLSMAQVTSPFLEDLSFSLEPVSTLRGRVVTRSGAPVAGAQVRLVRHPVTFRARLGLPRNSSRGSLADPQGRFLIIQVPDIPDLQLLALAEGFAPTLEPVPAVRDGEIELVLGPGSILQGRVVDGDGEPVTGARVRLFPEIRIGGRRISENRLSGARRDSGFDVTTGDEGRFRFSYVPSGGFTLQADAEGFVSRLLPGIEIPENEETAELGDVALERGVVLEGFVTDPQGTPLEGVRVTVVEGDRDGMMAARPMGRRMPRSGGVVSEMLTESDGRFRFDDLSSDTVYSVGAVREGWVPDVKVTEVPAPEPLELVLGSGGRLFGRVTTTSGEPLTRAMVRVDVAEDADLFIWRPPVWAQHVRLNDDGTFSFDALPSGAAKLRIHDDQGMSSEHGPFEMVSGADVGPLELVHEGGVELTGRVLGLDGEPAANVAVTWSQRSTGSSSVSTDASGQFRFHGVKLGPATVSAQGPERGQASQEVDVHAGRNRVELVLEPGLRVAGRVIGPDGRPVTQGRARVRPLVAPPTPAQRTMTDSTSRLGSDGSFSIPLAYAGDYAMRVEAPGYVPWDTSVDEPLRIGEEGVEDLMIRLVRGGRIVGLVSGLDEDELRQVQVRAQSSEPPQESRIGQVDYRGRYEIGSIDAGTWVVMATTDHPPRQLTREVVVSETGGETRLDLAFPEDELTLRGLVLLDGEPVAGSRVLVRSAAEPQAQPVTGHTDSFGRFRIAGLVPGRYEIQAHESPFDRGAALRGHREVELVTDQEIVLDLERVEPETE